MLKKKSMKYKKAKNGLSLTGDPVLIPGTLQKALNQIDPLNPVTAQKNQQFDEGTLQPFDPTDIANMQKLPYNPQVIKSENLKTPPSTIDPNFMGSTPNISPKKKTNWAQIGTGALAITDALIPQGNTGRKYVRPEQLQSYNSAAYGQGSQAIMKKGGKMKYCADGDVIEPLNLGREDNRGRPAPEDLLKRKDKFLSNKLAIPSLEHWSGINGNNNEAPSEREWWDNNLQYLINNNMNSNNYHDKFSHYSTTPTQKVVPNDTPTFAKKGAKISNHEGQLNVHSGGQASQISENPFDGGTGLLEGKSHEDGGIKATFAGKKFEGEGGEPYRIDSQGSLEIFGELSNPLTGNTFKKDAKVLAKKEQKTQKFIDAGTELINSTPESKNKFELLKFNSGQAMLIGALAKQKELAESKEHLSTLQTLMLDEHEPDKAEWGAKYEDGGKKPWKYKGTKVDRLDDKIKGFVKLVEEKGLEGYSGIKSGYDKRNTKSGHPSRHGSNQALDMIFNDPNAYQSILKDPELSAYLYKNGLTAINEYDPNIASKTGATQGHLHIGFDKGTPTSDQFRNDYKSLYSTKTNAPSIANPTSIPYQSAPVGDAQTEQIDWTPEQRLRINQIGQNLTTPIPLKNSEPFKFTNPKNNFVPLETKFPWEQTAPLIPALTDTTDPVLLQQYSPDLYSPYQVSFQDQRNRNTAQLRATQQQTAYDPSAAGTLGAQAYQANEGIDANEFRTNQGIYNDVLNKNVNLLNDAKQKNLQLADQQYVRQETAKGNTRDRRTEALVQLTDIVAKNQYENKLLNVTHNLYKDYTYDENMQLQYTGPNAQEQTQFLPGSTIPSPTKTEVTTKQGNTSTKSTYQPYPPIPPVKRTDIMDYYKKPKYKEGGKLTQNKLSKLMYS